MKNLGEKVIKKVSAIILILSMLVSYIPAAVFAGDETNNEEIKYVQFSANWSEGGTSITTENDVIKNIQYNLTLSGGPVFNNLAIYAEDVTQNQNLPTPYIKFGSMDNATVSGGGKSLIYNKSMNSGYSANGNITLSFPRTSDFTEYDKTIQLTVVGEYKLNGETTQINEVKTLTVHVVPQPIVEQFSSNVTNALELVKSMGTYSRYNSARDWAVSRFPMLTTIEVDSRNETYSNLKLYIDRTCSQDIQKSIINSEDNLTIDIRKDAGYTYNIVRESDGTTYIEFTRGEQLENFSSYDRKYNKAKIEVLFTYKVVEDTSTGTGSSLVTTKVNADVEGVTTVSSINGVEYTKGNYKYNVEKEYSINLWSNAGGTRVSNDYDTWIKGNDIEDKVFTEDARDGNFSATFTTEVMGDIQINDEPEECRLFVYNYNRRLYPSAYYDPYRYNLGRASISLFSGDDETKVYIDNDEMTLKKIKMTYFNTYKVDKVDFYKIDDDVNTATPFFTATSRDDEYIIPEGEEIKEYYAVITGYHGLYYSDYITLAKWDSEWNVNTSKLPSYANVSNIRKISRYQTGEYLSYTANNDWERTDGQIGNKLCSDCQSIATINIDFNEDHYASYAEFDLENYNGKVSTFGVWERNKKININFKPSYNSSERKTTRNENAKLYVQLPDEYEYKNFKVELNGNTNGYLYIKSYDQEVINGSQFLVIELDGTYQEDIISGKVGLTITHQRRLKTQDVPSILDVNVYMLTENEKYSRGISRNSYSFTNSLDRVPYNVMMLTNHFSVSESNHISTTTTIFKNNIEYEPGENEDGTINISSKQKPLMFEENNNVKYKSQIEVHEDRINNLDFIIRLPKQNNTPITTNSYNLDSTISLLFEDFNSLIIEKSGNRYTEIIPNTEYELLYSTEENATFNSSFQTFEENVDLSTVKTLRVKFNGDYLLEDGEQVRIIYQMKMPNAEGISGAITAVRYTKENETELQTLESTPAYVQKGNPNGNITLQKKFEGVQEGNLPLGVTSLAGIQFKLININTGEALVLNGQTTAEGIITTDAEGKCTLTDVPEGLYKVEELSTFDYYDGIDLTDVLVEQGTVTPTPVEVVNKLKRGNLTINKTWEGTDTQPYDDNEVITFKITGQNGVDFSAEKRLDKETGSVTFYGVPYGTYEVEETSGVYGWYLGNEELTVDVKEPEVSFEAENKIAKGKLVIVKTMPAEDDVREVSFKVTGKGISYTDTNGNEVKLDTDLTFKVGDYCDNTSDKIKVELNDSTKPTQATITIYDLPLATYKIEEVDIPPIPGSNPEVPMYKPITKRATINENGDVVRVALTNNWKTGNLKIVKTAAPGVDLTQFKVTVKLEETSYNTTYEKTFDIPASGELTISDLYLGTYSVTEAESDYYVAKYGEEKSIDPLSVEVLDGQTSEALIYNENTYGYVKVLKSLEDKDAENTIGIKFRLTGKDATGNDITEVDGEGNNVLGMTREITEESIITDETTHKKYGTVVFGPLQAGGEYGIEELNTPEFYREMDPIKVDIKKTDTFQNPQEIIVENKRQRGNLEITTKTVPDGGPLSPIKYRVREIKLNDDCTYTPGNIVAELNAVAGFAKLDDIYAGTYLVEQTVVPDHYIMDYPQIVEVPDKGTGYAEFEIERPELKNTNVTIEKEIVTTTGETATAADFTAAGLSSDEIFEVRVTNIDTQTTYFTFMNTQTPGKIKGIPAGTYEIEEVYKPKYLSSAYYLKENDEYSEIGKTDGKILFVVREPSGSEGTEVTIKVKNTINASFGFAGQDSKNNFSKTTIAEANRVSKTVINIMDEDGKAVTGAKFKIYYEDGREVPISFDDNTYVVGTDKRLIINGLPKGKYIIKALSIPEGYLPVEDKEFVAYDNATVVTRIEVLKNVPRGNLTLSTIYTNDNGDTVYAPRSKYKILDPLTGKVLKFEKTASGDYVRSKQDSATDTISLRAGTVTVRGIEVGNYQLGLVDLTEQYGVVNEEVENISIAENDTISKEVTVEKRYAFKKVVGDVYRDIYALTENGNVYVYSGQGSYSYIGNITNNYEMKEISEVYPNLKGKKFVDIGVNKSYGQILVLVDEDGKVWTNNYLYNKRYNELNEMVCISDIDGNPLNNVVIKRVVGNDHNKSMYAIDEAGNIWRWGESDGIFPSSQDPILISSDNILEGKNIVQISGDIVTFALDSNGELYVWGNNYCNRAGIGYDDGSGKDLQPVCVTESEGSNLYGKKIKKVANTYDASFFIDSNNDLYVCGKNNNGLLGVNSTDEDKAFLNPYCLTSDNTNKLYNKKIIDISVDYNKVYVADSDGKVWGWGYPNGYYGLGELDYEQKNEPVNISEFTDNKLDTVKIKSVFAEYGNGSGNAIDENGDLWVWGTAEKPVGRAGADIPAERLNVTQKSYFDLFEVKDIKITGDSSCILDTSGRLWNANGTIDYLATENGAEIEGVTIKDYAINGSFDNSDYNGNAAIIGDNGELWTIGYVNYPYTYEGYGNIYEWNSGISYDERKVIKPVCVTDIESCVLHNKEIVYAAVGNGYSNYSSVAVIDKDGKLYTEGGKYTYNLGYTPGQATYVGNTVPFECLNDKYEYLKDVKFVKVCIYNYYTMIALDTEGRLWSWGDKSDCSLGVIPTSYYEVDGRNDYMVPTQLSIDAKIVDMQIYNGNGIAVDDNGNLYVWGTSSYYDVSSSQTPTLVNSQYNPVNGKKIAKVGIGSGYRMVMDEDGEIFIYSTSSLMNSNSLTQSFGIVAKEFYNGEHTIIVRDSEDGLWLIGQGSTVGYSKNSPDPELLTGVKENKLYGAEIVKVIDNIVIVKDGDKQILYEISDGVVSDGIEIKQFEYYIDSNASKTYYMCVDTNNRLYLKNQSTGTFKQQGIFDRIMDVKNGYALLSNPYTGVYLATYLTGSSMSTTIVERKTSGTTITGAWVENVNASASSSSSYIYIAFVQKSDNSLVVKKIGSNAIEPKILGIAGSTSSSTGGNVTEYAGSQITDMYVTTTCSTKGISVYCIDSDNKLWAWGANYIGNNATDGSETPVVVMENAKKILASGSNYYFGGYYTYVLDTDNNLWAWGNAAIGNGETTGSLVPVKVLTDVKDVQLSTYGAYVLDNSGNVWVMGYNRYGNLGTAATPSDYKIYTPINLVEQAGIDPIKELKVFNSSNVDAINTTGKLYGWGYRNRAWKTPTVIDENVGLNAHFEDNYLVKDNGVKYSLPDTLTITEQTGYILKPDGKIYYHTSSDDYLFNGEQYVYGPWVKKFVLIKDSKYNN